MDPQLSAWLRRVRHDLVKRLLWPARDRRDMGGDVRPGELEVKLIDAEGKPATTATVWNELRDDAPQPEHPALAEFERSMLAAAAATQRDDVDGVLALEAAFEELVQRLAKDPG